MSSSIALQSDDTLIYKQTSKTKESTTESINIAEIINKTSQKITPVWPLETFIACNPLGGLEAKPFESALQEASGYWDSHAPISGLEKVNKEMIKWCGAFLDMGQGTIHMPNREKGFLRGFLSLAIYDNELHMGLVKHKNWIQSLPHEAEKVILLCLKQLGIPAGEYESFIQDSLNYLPGWAGYVKWRSGRKDSEELPQQLPVNLTEFLAVRLVLTVIIWPGAHKKKKINTLI